MKRTSRLFPTVGHLGEHRAETRGATDVPLPSGEGATTHGEGDAALGLVSGRYRLIEVIGAGGMGVVWRCRDERLLRDVAIKVLPTRESAEGSALERFKCEALALSRLSHPNIAAVFDFDRHDGTDFLVMEYVAGIPLDARLRTGPLSASDVVQYGVQLLEGLAAAHASGVIHRDLKPANIKVTPDGRLKILDFGLAKLRGMAGVMVDSLTETRVALGTLPYMAPEVLRGEDADARSDIYAAGAVLYEMITGGRAFPQPLEPMVIDAILHERPTLPRQLHPGLDPHLERVTLRALEKLAHDRYQTAVVLVMVLRKVGSAPPQGRSGGRVGWRRTWHWLAALLAVVVLGSAAFLAMRTWAPAPREAPLPAAMGVSLASQGRVVERVEELSSPGHDFSASLAGEGLDIIVERVERSPVTGKFGNSHLYAAHRASPTARFGPPLPVCGVYSEATDGQPWLSQDGLRLYFTSTRCSGGPYSCVYMASRPDTSSCFADPTLIQSAAPASVAGPSLTPDELAIFFDRRDPAGDADIWYALRESSSGPFGSPRPLAEINTDYDEAEPFLSPDRRLLYFASNRPGGMGRADIWVARRRTPDGPFDPPVNMSAVNSAAEEGGPTLAVTGEFFFFSNRPTGAGQTDVWRLRLVPRILTPRARQVVRGRVVVVGAAASLGLVKHTLAWREAGATSWEPPQAQVISSGSVGGGASVATVWVTDGLQDGPYEFRLWGTDSLGLSGSVVVPVTVANRRSF